MGIVTKTAFYPITMAYLMPLWICLQYERSSNKKQLHNHYTIPNSIREGNLFYNILQVLMMKMIEKLLLKNEKN